MNPNRNRSLTFSVAVAVLLIVFLSVLTRQPEWVETFYTQRFYFALTGLLSPLTSAVSISLSEICLYLCLLAAIWFWLQLLRRRAWKRSLRRMLLGAAVLVAWFYVAWGCNYFRTPIDQQLGFARETAALDSLTFRRYLEQSIAVTNRAWRPAAVWNLSQLDSMLEHSYQRLFSDLSLPLAPGSRRPKHLLVPALLNYTLTSGIFSPFLHEVHLNSELLPVELPFVLAHEKAHQMGYARESEASFLGVLACLASADSAVQYAGHFALLESFLARAALLQDADSLRRRVRPEVRADLIAVRQRSLPYRGVLSQSSRRMYDAYLRANRVSGGTQNYGEVIELMIRWREQQALPK